MVEVTILIPVAGNSGVPFSRAHVLQFEAQVLERFSGLTRLPATVVGRWLDDGHDYRDVLVAYVVAVKGVIEEGDRLREVIDLAKSHFRQEAIFCRYLGVAEIL